MGVTALHEERWLELHKRFFKYKSAQHYCKLNDGECSIKLKSKFELWFHSWKTNDVQSNIQRMILKKNPKFIKIQDKKVRTHVFSGLQLNNALGNHLFSSIVLKKKKIGTWCCRCVIDRFLPRNPEGLVLDKERLTHESVLGADSYWDRRFDISILYLVIQLDW